MALSSSAMEGEKPPIQTNTPIRAFKFTQSHTQPCLFIRLMSMHLQWQKKRGGVIAFPPVLRQYYITHPHMNTFKNLV